MSNTVKPGLLAFLCLFTFLLTFSNAEEVGGRNYEQDFCKSRYELASEPVMVLNPLTVGSTMTDFSICETEKGYVAGIWLDNKHALMNGVIVDTTSMKPITRVFDEGFCDSPWYSNQEQELFAAVMDTECDEPESADNFKCKLLVASSTDLHKIFEEEINLEEAVKSGDEKFIASDFLTSRVLYVDNSRVLIKFEYADCRRGIVEYNYKTAESKLLFVDTAIMLARVLYANTLTFIVKYTNEDGGGVLRSGFPNIHFTKLLKITGEKAELTELPTAFVVRKAFEVAKNLLVMDVWEAKSKSNKSVLFDLSAGSYSQLLEYKGDMTTVSRFDNTDLLISYYFEEEKNTHLFSFDMKSRKQKEICVIPYHLDISSHSRNGKSIARVVSWGDGGGTFPVLFDTKTLKLAPVPLDNSHFFHLKGDISSNPSEKTVSVLFGNELTTFDIAHGNKIKEATIAKEKGIGLGIGKTESGRLLMFNKNGGKNEYWDPFTGEHVVKEYYRRILGRERLLLEQKPDWGLLSCDGDTPLIEYREGKFLLRGRELAVPEELNDAAKTKAKCALGDSLISVDNLLWIVGQDKVLEVRSDVRVSFANGCFLLEDRKDEGRQTVYRFDKTLKCTGKISFSNCTFVQDSNFDNLCMLMSNKQNLMVCKWQSITEDEALPTLWD